MKFIYALVIAFICSITLSALITGLYNTFIGIPRGLIIEKRKKYKTVVASIVISGTNNIRDYNSDEEWRSGKHWLRYEWEVDNKKYIRSIHTTSWPGPVATFYYLNNPKFAMPSPRELGRFRYSREVMLFCFIIVFFIVSLGKF